MVTVIAVPTKKTRFQISGVNQVTTMMKISALEGIIFSRSRQATIIKPNKMSNSQKYQKIKYAIEEKRGKTYVQKELGRQEATGRGLQYFTERFRIYLSEVKSNRFENVSEPERMY